MGIRIRYVLLFSIVLIGFFCYGLFFPVKLSVQVLNDIYAGDTLKKTDFKVKSQSLFGLKKDVTNKSVFVSEKGNKAVRIYWKNLSVRKKLLPIKADDLKLTVSGSCYAGCQLRPEQVKVEAVYGDEVRPVMKYELSQIPFSVGEKKKTVLVHTDIGDVTSEVKVVQPDYIEAHYDSEVSVGSSFNPHKVYVVLHYNDGFSYRIRDFVIHNQKETNGKVLSYNDFAIDGQTPMFPEYIKDDLHLFVISPYGSADLNIHPKKESSLKGVYDGVVYQCEKLKEDNIKITVEKNGQEELVTNYKYKDVGYMLMDSKVCVPTVYGDVILSIKPVLVKKVSVKTGECLGGQKPVIESVELEYEDGQKKTLSDKDVKWLNLPSVWEDGNQTIWFSYHGFDFSSDVYVVSKHVVDFRTKRKAEQGIGYDVSDDDLKKLTLICQKVGNQSLDLNADEIALMLNRYDLYHEEDESLLSYVYRDGYWGDKETIEASISGLSVNEDLVLLLEDAVRRGYRVLPSYVTERYFETSVKEKNSSDYEKDLTLLSLDDGKQCRFYQSESDDSSVLYCYDESIYEEITGNAPPSAIPVNPAESVDTSIEGDDTGITIE